MWICRSLSTMLMIWLTTAFKHLAHWLTGNEQTLYKCLLGEIKTTMNWVKQNIVPNTRLHTGETSSWLCKRLRNFPVSLRTTAEPDILVRVVSWKSITFVFPLPVCWSAHLFFNLLIHPLGKVYLNKWKYSLFN